MSYWKNRNDKRKARRVYYATLKKYRQKQLDFGTDWSRFNMIRIETPRNCSCPMCGNQRQHWGSSFQERRQALMHTD